jgi:hypothetical protein
MLRKSQYVGEGGREELAKSIIWTSRQTDRQKTRKLFICSYCVLLLSPPYSRALLEQSVGSSNSSCSFPSPVYETRSNITVSTAVHTGTYSPQPPSQQQATASPLLISDVRIHGSQFYFGKKPCCENGSCDPQILLKSLSLS